MNSQTQILNLILIGAGGHARVVIDAARRSGRFKLLGLIDHDESQRGSSVDGVERLGGDDLLADTGRFAGAAFVVAIGGRPGSTHRRELFERATNGGLEPAPPIIHPAATIAETAEIEPGSLVVAGAVVQPGAVVGRNVIVNTRAVIEHDVTVGDHTHVAPGAILLGGVAVGGSAHLGAGCVVLEGRKVGDRAIIGAGAVVLHDVSPGETVAGVPARPIGSGS